MDKLPIHTSDIERLIHFNYLNVTWLSQFQFAFRHGEQLFARGRKTTSGRVCQPVAIFNVNQGRDSELGAYRGDTPNMVNMPVGQNNGGGREPVRADNFIDSLHGILAWINDDGRLAWALGHHISVGGPGAGGKTLDQHKGASLAMGTLRHLVEPDLKKVASQQPVYEPMESRYMSSQKRERDLARAKFERQQIKRSERAQRAKRNQRFTAIVVVIALVVAGVGFAVFSAVGDDSAPVAQESQTPPDPTASETATAAAAVECAVAGTARADDISYPDGPQALDFSPTTLTLNTNCGVIEIALDPNAPETVASEAFLASSGFYDNTSCHRLTTEGIYVLQCGDPAGNGSGGPGYSIPDENLPEEGSVNYPAGTIAMANAGPGTSGSQFFIVYADTSLPAGYSIWGTVTSGLGIVQDLASAGVEGGLTDGPPAQPVFINTATVS